MANSVTLSSAAMSNLLSLNNTSALIDRTQIRLSTGLAVNSALDDAMAFFKARNLTSRAQDLTTIKSDIENGLNVVKTATDSLGQIETFLTQAKAAANSARAEKDVNIRATYINQINETLARMVDLAADANYDGINLIQAVPDVDQSSAAGLAAVNALGVQTAATPVGPTAMPQTYLDRRLGSDAIAGTLIRAIAAGTTATITGTPPAAVASLAFAPNSTVTDISGATLSMSQSEAEALGFSSTPASPAGTVVQSGNNYYVLVNSPLTTTGNTVIRVDLGQTATAAQAAYTRADDQADINAVRAGTAPYTTGPNPLAADRLQARFDRGYQDLVNGEVRSNPAIYQDLVGFTTPETLTVIFSEQDKNRRLDINARALGDQLTGLVGGVTAIVINPADWTATDGKSPNTQAIDEFVATIDDAAKRIRAYASELGNYSQIMSIRGEFTDNMVNTLKGGAADLVNADMNQESANMLALQTRQQLGVIALSIAQESEQAVLRLF